MFPKNKLRLSPVSKKQKLVGIPTGDKPVVLRYNYPMNIYDLQDGTKIPLILPDVNPQLFDEV